MMHTLFLFMMGLLRAGYAESQGVFVAQPKRLEAPPEPVGHFN